MNDCEPKIVLTTKKILELAGLITLKAQNENLILHAVDAELQRDLVEKDFPLITEKRYLLPSIYLRLNRLA